MAEIVLDPRFEKVDERAPEDSNLAHLGGSTSDAFNTLLIEAVQHTAWIRTAEEAGRSIEMIGAALAGIAPRDEIEGMIAGQMVAAHQASMECFRRSMLPSQTTQGREANLNQANKASRTFVALVETLNRHRGNGSQQRVVVEHVHRHIHVHQDGTPLTEKMGATLETSEQSHAKPIPHASDTIGAMRSKSEVGQALPRASDGEREMPHARRIKSRRAEGRG